jgi:tryptophanyl-tRNA synthetase
MDKKSVFNPWEVSGEVDYDKLVKEFGTKKITKEIFEKLKDCHPLLKRGVYFSHRDFDKWLEAYEKGEMVSVITGRGPSEKMHIGHLVQFMVAKSLQDVFGCQVFIPISDDEKFYVKEKLDYEKALEYSKDNILDIIALGFDPEKTFIFQDFEFTNIYRYAAKIAKRITYSTSKAIFGLTPEQNIGWSFYPAIQAAHILFPQFYTGKKHISVVPVGMDQDPFIRLTRDIATNKNIDLEKPCAIHSKFIPSLDGGAKMSASGNYVIFLDDDEKTVKDKINKNAFSGGQKTLEEHREKGGKTKIDVCFQYLKMFFEQDDEKLEQIKQDYESGKMLTGELKKYTIEKINKFLNEHKKKKEQAKKVYNKFILKNE